MTFGELPRITAFSGQDLAKVLGIVGRHVGKITGPITGKLLQVALAGAQKEIDERPSHLSIQTAIMLRDNPNIASILRPATPEGFRALSALDLIGRCLRHWDDEVNAEPPAL